MAAVIDPEYTALAVAVVQRAMDDLTMAPEPAFAGRLRQSVADLRAAMKPTTVRDFVAWHRHHLDARDFLLDGMWTTPGLPWAAILELDREAVRDAVRRRENWLRKCPACRELEAA